MSMNEKFREDFYATFMWAMDNGKNDYLEILKLFESEINHTINGEETEYDVMFFIDSAIGTVEAFYKHPKIYVECYNDIGNSVLCFEDDTTGNDTFLYLESVDNIKVNKCTDSNSKVVGDIRFAIGGTKYVISIHK